MNAIAISKLIYGEWERERKNREKSKFKLNWVVKKNEKKAFNKEKKKLEKETTKIKRSVDDSKNLLGKRSNCNIRQSYCQRMGNENAYPHLHETEWTRRRNIKNWNWKE